MRYKSYYLFIYLTILLLVLVAEVFAKCCSDVKLSTPEETLNTYIDALRQGNIDKVLKSYYSDREDFKFHLSDPRMIERYKIVKKKIYTEQMAEKYIAIPKAKAGDVELDVKEYIGGHEEMFTYLLRRINQEWRIISHSSWDQPD